MIKRSIAHMDLDSFFVSCARLVDSSLNGKPVIIGGSSDRGVVSTCSYEARKFGIHSAMPMKTAKRLCPEALIVKGDMQLYSKLSTDVTSIIAESVPLFQKASIDEFYMDLTGMDTYYNSWEIAKGIRKRIISEIGLPISFGLSENKTVSKIATGEAKPNNELFIPYGEEKAFLAPLSIDKIPMVGKKTYQTLTQMGISKIDDIQNYPREEFEFRFGKYGGKLWNKANGVDISPVREYSERKSISTERTFETDITDLEFIRTILVGMTDKLSYQLRQKSKITGNVAIKIRYEDFSTFTMQQQIPYSAADHKLLPFILELFNKIYSPGRKIRLIGIRLSHLINGGQQFELFENADKLQNFYNAVDKVKGRFGNKAIGRASGLK